jgi:hypothetical protein
MNTWSGWTGKMHRTVPATMAVAFLLGGFGTATPASARDGATPFAVGTASNAYAQERPRLRRAPTRIRVTPRCPYRTQASEFPPAANCDYPGPGFVRQCEARLLQENRPSGTVIVPRMWCWWEPG